MVMKVVMVLVIKSIYNNDGIVTVTILVTTPYNDKNRRIAHDTICRVQCCFGSCTSLCVPT